MSLLSVGEVLGKRQSDLRLLNALASLFLVSVVDVTGLWLPSDSIWLLGSEQSVTALID